MKLHLNYQVMNTHKNLRNHKTSEASKSTNQKSNLKLTWNLQTKNQMIPYLIYYCDKKKQSTHDSLFPLGTPLSRSFFCH